MRMVQPDLTFEGQRKALAEAAEQSAANNDLSLVMSSAQGLMRDTQKMGRDAIPNRGRPTGLTPELVEALRNNDAAEINRIIAAMKGDISKFGAENEEFASRFGDESGNGEFTGDSVFARLLYEKEGAGNYDTLFGHSQKDGGRFAGVRVSQMPIKDVIAFSDPNGEYGNWVKQELARTGQEPRIATPMGAGQIVGKTLRGAVAELGLDPNAMFDANTQNKIIDHLARKRIMSSNTVEGRRAALREEWEGFQSVPDNVLDRAINELLGRYT